LPLLASASAGLAISTVCCTAEDEKARIGYDFAGLEVSHLACMDSTREWPGSALTEALAGAGVLRAWRLQTLPQRQEQRAPR
jgi:hypothetical protein